MIKKISLTGLAIVSTLALSGCATLFGNNGRSVSVNTQPQGAQVYLNGQPIGTTPTTVQLASISNNYLQISKKGYQTTSVQIDTTFQKVGLWNILFWPGFIVDAVSGDMMKISNTDMTVQLQSNGVQGAVKKHHKKAKVTTTNSMPANANTAGAQSNSMAPTTASPLKVGS